MIINYNVKEVMNLYNTGDRVVFPNQGVGIIDAIESREFKDTMQDYYDIHLINSTLKLMLPCNRMETSNARLVSDSQTLDKYLNNFDYFLCNGCHSTNIDSKQRIKDNRSKLSSGTLKDYVEVIIELTHIQNDSKLNSSEKQILNNARKILVDEISLSKNLTTIEATSLLDNSLATI